MNIKNCDKNMKKKILIIEDEIYIFELINAILGKDFDLIYANNGINGLISFYKSVPDIVLLDLMLPEINGVQIFNIIRSDDRYSNIPIIIMTALKEEIECFDVVNNKPDAFLYKPFGYNELLFVLKDVLNKQSDIKEKTKYSLINDEDVFSYIVKLLESKVRNFAVLNSLMKLALGKFDTDGIIKHAIENIYKLYKPEEISVYFLDNSKLRIYFYIKHGKYDVLPDKYKEIVLKKYSTDIIKDKLYLNINDIVVPISKDEELYGFLIVSKIKSQFSPDKDLIGVIAGYIALAINKDRLYDEIRKKAHELEEANNNLKMYQAEMILKEKLISMGQMFCSLAHEINNPLASISGFAQILRDSLKNEKQIEFCKRIIEETGRINNLTERFLSFSKTSKNLEKIDLIKILDEVLFFLRAHSNLNFKDIDVTVQPEKGNFFVKFNRNEMIQILFNLSLNAAQACKNNGKILYYFSEDDKNIYLDIADNGSGISENIKEKIFQPFFSTKGNEGTGLGLPICFFILKKYKGSISVVENKYFNKGACFRLKFIKG